MFLGLPAWSLAATCTMCCMWQECHSVNAPRQILANHKGNVHTPTIYMSTRGGQYNFISNGSEDHFYEALSWLSSTRPETEWYCYILMLPFNFGTYEIILGQTSHWFTQRALPQLTQLTQLTQNQQTHSTTPERYFFLSRYTQYFNHISFAAIYRDIFHV